VAVAVYRFDCLDPLYAGHLLWLPEARAFRHTQAFRDKVRPLYLSVWRTQGFPPQCHALGDDDFECD